MKILKNEIGDEIKQKLFDLSLFLEQLSMVKKFSNDNSFSQKKKNCWNNGKNLENISRLLKRWLFYPDTSQNLTIVTIYLHLF